MKSFNFHNLSKPTKAIIIVSLAVTILASLEYSSIYVQADHDTLTFPISPGSNPITFRDITKLQNQTASISTLISGNSLSITVNDPDANIDLSGLDTIFATANSTSSNPASAIATLKETGVSTGTFSGAIILSSDTTTGSILEVGPGDDVSTFYNPELEGVGRLSADIILSSGTGTVELSDVIITTAAQVDCTFSLVTHPVLVDLSGPVVASSIDITLSYANSLLGSNIPPSLRILYAPTGSATFTSLTPPGVNAFGTGLDLSGHNLGGLTITNIDQPSAIEGQYAIGRPDPGCIGGGGGGLVSPGLVVNALAGLTGGSGGGSPQSSLNNLIGSRVIDVPEEVQQMVVNHDSYSTILPMDPDSFEGFDFPLVINNQGFVLGGFTNTLQTSTIKTDTPVTMTFTVYTADKVQHFSLYTNLRDADDSIPKSDTQILYNDGKDLKIIDPNGFFSDAKITVIDDEDSVKKHITVEMTFANEMDTSHIIARMWDSHLRSGDIHMLDAIKIVSAEPEFVPIPQATEEIQVEELKSETIPKWVKNNAEWWVDQQIGDEDFVAGIQYMVNNGIMYIPNTEPENSVTEIPDWIKTNVQWWVDNQISDDDFVKSMEWLVTNGVLRIE